MNDPARRGSGGNITYATITTFDESPIVPGVLWAGTDDGNVQVTRNGGQSWTNVRDKIPGHPGFWVSRVAASNASAGTAYVTMTGLRHDDVRPFIWKTTDFGETWTLDPVGATPPFNAQRPSRIAFDPRQPGVRYAAIFPHFAPLGRRMAELWGRYDDESLALIQGFVTASNDLRANTHPACKPMAR